MKYFFGFLLAVSFILGLLSAAVTAESLYISLSQASTAYRVVFGVVVGGTVLGAIAIVLFFSRPSHCYYGD